MNEVQKEKLSRFVNDEVLFSLVFLAIQDSFLKPIKQTDVNFLAASRIAIDLLADAEKDLLRLVSEQEDKKEKGGQIAL